jgi:putative membrane protein (TIGR04086 family)
MRWGRIIAGGFLAEVVLIVVAIPSLAFGDQNILNWVAVIGSAVTSCGAGIWVARRVDSRFVVHGALTGLAAALIYITLIVASGQTQPLIYWVAHGFKIAGGAAGGMFVARRMANASTNMGAGTSVGS